MIKVKELINFLSKYNEDDNVVWSDGSDIKHISSGNGIVILSHENPTRTCCRCGCRVFTENNISQYPYYCPNCDENMFEIETEKD